MKKRIISCILALIAVSSIMMSGCTSKNQASSDTVRISIGNWPTQEDQTGLERMEYFVGEMKKKYPNIEIVPDTWAYKADTFIPKAASKQLPTVYNTFFTEIDKIVDAGYAADITEYMDKYKYSNAINNDIRDILKKDEKFYAIPQSAYSLGLMVNMNLFKQAGLLNDDGTAKIPQTYEEILETSKIIKEKTGKAGFILPTTGNMGGWLSTQIAWSFGTEFMAKEGEKWVAKFDSPEFRNFLQYIRDMRWKDNVMFEKGLIDYSEMIQLFSTNQAAMTINSTGYMPTVLVEQYGMSKDAISIGAAPAGPKGRYSLIGGDVSMIAPNATPEQIDAAFKWFEVTGASPVVTTEAVAAMEKRYELDAAKGLMVGIEGLNIWDKTSEVAKSQANVLEKYKNVNTELFKDYINMDGSTMRVEEPIKSQELYKIIDNCLQAVISDENASIDEVVKKAADNFQKNYLNDAQ
ncbi:MAG: extracellular solute-binding protein [Oscillospiraceae bacterium]